MHLSPIQLQLCYHICITSATFVSVLIKSCTHRSKTLLLRQIDMLDLKICLSLLNADHVKTTYRLSSWVLLLLISCPKYLYDKIFLPHLLKYHKFIMFSPSWDEIIFTKANMVLEFLTVSVNAISTWLFFIINIDTCFSSWVFLEIYLYLKVVNFLMELDRGIVIIIHITYTAYLKSILQSDNVSKKCYWLIKSNAFP